eukprot:TRINITY_DN2398_c0_g1_i1.p2 TRINITY_DN2398_c0_g1~~TRINITY_DN2398_c0_g1_i1.p2  ORF type:complete len:145 (+),score=35.18 TRINITY_DN2398_c0_g1_i1:72-506(+)
MLLRQSLSRFISATQRQGRFNSIAAFSTQSDAFTEAEFHAHANEELEDIAERLEALETVVDLDAFDVTCQMGVLTLKLGPPHGTYVINKQTPNKQIWLSSPSSGPKRYDYDADQKKWIYKHDSKGLRTLLKEELDAKLGIPVHL